MDSILNTNKLTKTFAGKGKKARDVEAVRGVDLEVKKGEIFGFLGPNGAGKTTTLQMLVTLLTPTSGGATVVGHDLRRDPQAIRREIGYVSQAGGTDVSANAFENIILQGRLYGMTFGAAEAKAKELVERFKMSDFAERNAASYSGGQKRRLDLALGIVHQPPLVFLDEPTIGLDPQSRAYFWEEIERLNHEGITIFLTTHYLDEADNLCDRLAIIDNGQIVALGTPQELKRQIGGESIIVDFSNLNELARAEQVLAGQPFIQKTYPQDDKLHLYVERGDTAMMQVLRILDREQVPVQAIELSRPSLDDVFLQKTGRSLRETANT